MGNLSDQHFNAAEVEPSGTFNVLPKGDYVVQILDSEWKQTAKGDGRYLALELQVENGEHRGRTLWCNLNLENKSAKAMEIARGTLSAICRAVGVLTPSDSSELHFKPLIAVVRIKTDDQYGDKNEVRGFKPVDKPAPAKIVDQAPATRKKTTTKLVTTTAEVEAAIAEAGDDSIPF